MGGDRGGADVDGHAADHVDEPGPHAHHGAAAHGGRGAGGGRGRVQGAEHVDVDVDDVEPVPGAQGVEQDSCRAAGAVERGRGQLDVGQHDERVDHQAGHVDGLAHHGSVHLALDGHVDDRVGQQRAAHPSRRPSASGRRPV